MSKSFIIAGNYGGKKVKCVPAIVSTYQNLLAAALKGNYWARIAVSDLQALTSGRIGKKNIFIRSTGNVNTRVGNEEFYVFLPGIRATAESLPNGEYKVVNLVLDPGYFRSNEANKPGLHSVSHEGGDWRAKYSKSGKVKNEKNRVVAISDACYMDSGKAAKSAANKIVHAPGAPKKGRMFNSAGFDMHYTPGSSPLGGLRNYNSLNNANAYGSAKLLAQAMFDAKNIKGINWVSERGGSVVLVQAMQILVDQGITLDGHSAFMHLPKSSPRQALKLAHSLNLVMDEEFVKTGFVDTVATLSSLSTSMMRINNGKDPYGWGSAGKELGYGLLKQSTGLSVIAGIAAMGGTASGITAPAMAAIITAATVGAKATGIIALAQGTASWGQSLLESHKK